MPSRTITSLGFPILFAAGLGSACSDGVVGIVLGDRDVSVDLVEPKESDGGQGGQAPVGASTGGAGGQGGAEVVETWDGSTCVPTVTLDNRDTTPEGADIEELLSPPNELLAPLVRQICLELYPDPSAAPAISAVTLVIEPSETPGSIVESTVALSSTHLLAVEDEGGDAEQEAKGMLVFFVSHLLLNSREDDPPWLISGLADYLRLSAGYLDPNTRAPGGSVTDGFRTTAFFFDWVEGKHPGFIQALNERLHPDQPPYSEAIFEELTGANLSILWQEYQLSLEM